MYAELTSKDQLTTFCSIIMLFTNSHYDVPIQDDAITPNPLNIVTSDIVRSKLEYPGIIEKDIPEAVQLTRKEGYSPKQP